MRARSLPALLLASAIASIAGVAGAQTVDEQAELQKGQYAYTRALKTRAADPAGAARDFSAADEAFKRMLDPLAGTLHDRLFIDEARMYEGATLVALGHRAEAAAQFEKILEVDANYAPDPVVFPVDVGTVFIDAKVAYQNKLKEIEAERREREKRQRETEEMAKRAQVERLREVEVLAEEEHIVDHHSRWVALLPFGVGQFQNGSNGLGAFFLSSEALFLAGGIVTVPLYLTELHNVSTAYQGPQDSVVAQQYIDRANEVRYVNLISYGALAFTAIAGVLEAQLAYVPDVSRTKTRKLPDLPGVSPDAKPAAEGPAVRMTFGATPLFGGEGRGVTGALVGAGGRF